MRFPFISLSYFALWCVLTTLAVAQKVTIRDAIAVPEECNRVKFTEGSFSEWIQNLPLKQEKEVKRYDGKVVKWGSELLAVVDAPLMFKNDLEQCADFCMRFWGDFHQETGNLDRLYLFDYNGRRKMFRDTGKTYREFLRWAFAYSNSHSLKERLQPVLDCRFPATSLYKMKQAASGTFQWCSIDVNRELERLSI